MPAAEANGMYNYAGSDRNKHLYAQLQSAIARIIFKPSRRLIN